MVLRTLIMVVAIGGLTLLIFYGALDEKHEEKKARLVVENNSGDTITEVVVTLTGEPCRVESIASGDQAECVFGGLEESDYALTFVKADGEKINKTDLGHVRKGLFWNDRIILGEDGSIEMSRAMPHANGVDFSVQQ